MIVAVLVLHGVGHSVGFWMPVPLWFAFAWLVPGAAFVGTAWGAWNHAEWWPFATIGAAFISAGMLLLQLNVLRAPGPFASAFGFDLLAVAVLLLPWSRRLLVAA